MSGHADGHLTHLTKEDLGYVTLNPVEDVVAGSYGTWTLIYRAGQYGMDVGGGLKIGTRRMSDWGIPQFHDPKIPNYVTCSSSRPEVDLEIYFDAQGHIRTYRAVTVVRLKGPILYPNDTITLILGDGRGGSKGMKVQSFPETCCEFAVFADTLSSGVYQRVPQVSSHLRVIPGPAQSFTIQAPSKVLMGDPFRVKVHGADIFGNPTPLDLPDLTISSDPPISFSFKKENGRATWIHGVALSQPGLNYLELHKGDRILARSNPILVQEKRGVFNLYWGDTQAQTASTVGTGSVEEYYGYARDLAGIDFCSHQANDFMVTHDSFQEILKGASDFYEPGRFVTFPGYEWSGTTAMGGDRNLLFTSPKIPLYRSSSWQLPEGEPELERSQVSELFKELDNYERERRGQVLSIPHVGGRRANLAYHHCKIEPLLEICSCHGIFEWFLHDALKRGYQVGVIGASDDHTCRPGLAYPSNKEMAIQGGLTGVYAQDLTRESILSALLSRRCYATTGERILIWVEAEGHPMGSIFQSTRPPLIKVKVAGTAPLDEVSIFNQEKEVYIERPNPLIKDQKKLKILFTGAKGQDRNRYLDWEGSLSLSKGKILSVQPLNITSPREGVNIKGERDLSWTSLTVGQRAGFILTLDAPSDTRINFTTDPASLSFLLKDIYTDDLHRHVGGEGGKVQVSTWISSGEKQEIQFHYQDQDLEKGDHAFYVRVLQRDLHLAWSSPIYVKFL